MNKLRIIYIEDNLTDFDMVKAVLDEEGLVDEIIRVEKKDEFIINLKEFKPDLVLSDFHLPVFHGMEALEIMRKNYPDIPFIMVTGNLSDEIAVDLIKKGAWDYVLKENIVRLVPSINYSLEIKRIKEERENAIKSLQESENNYRILAESSPYGIIVHSDGKIVYYNQAAKRIIGEDDDSLLNNLDLFKFMHDDSREGSEKRIAGLYKGKQFPIPTEVKYYNPKGDLLYLEVASSSIKYKGKPAAQVIFQDINARKKFEQELLESKNKAVEADRLKTAFLENMSHEIRTPLNGIIGFASLLKFRDISDDEKESYINVIEDSGKHLLNIIDDLIEISQIETGHIEIRMESFDLNVLLDELKAFYSNSEKYKNLPIELIFSSSLTGSDAYILSDKHRLKQVLINLLSNAYKFTSTGSIEFGYKVRDDLLEFYVRDTGSGIKEEAQEIIFDRFRQADESTTRKHGGNGLGLTISKAIVETLGGKIWLESEVDKGSTFYFTIPFKTPPKEILIKL